MAELTDLQGINSTRRSRPSIIVLGVATAILIGGVVLLISGGDDPRADPAGDLTYVEGSGRRRTSQQGQLVASIADVTDADVQRGGESVTFSAITAVPLPQSLKMSALQFRWDLTGDDGARWIIVATVEKSIEATVSAKRGGLSEASPASVVINHDRIEVRVDVQDIPQFPTAFEWRLATTLRAFRNEADSPRVTDRYPDDGAEKFEG